MCSHFPTKALSMFAAAALVCTACNRGTQPALASEQGQPGVIDTALTPGRGFSVVTDDPRAKEYYDNAEAVSAGKKLFAQYNCSGCHSNGGGGMGPSLMDDEWIYGSRLVQIHQTLVEGRPNGMPAWGGKIPDQQLWQIATYVRSMSLPQTLAAQNGPTPSQSPAPVPPEADQDSGWSPPSNTTNDYTTTTKGAQ
jgi:cytochrome c oxidase cbb3-type subunit III